jgi:Na+-translocating ferredoxin:NAD+ oxidoreductase subunit G
MKASPLQPTRSLLLVGLVASAGIALVSTTHRCTEARIAAQARLVPQQRLETVLPASKYDNDILRTERRIDAQAIGSAGSALVYVARREGQPVAVVFDVVSPDGYHGPIRLLIGVYRDGTIAGVRVVSHHETPGLGDAIEARKSGWILQFAGKSLYDPPADEWSVDRDGGAFDQISGATITSRAVVGAVRRALVYFADRKAKLFGRFAQDAARQ